MRTFNAYQNNLINNNNTEGNLSSLASKFMDMFDLSKMESSLLQKRQALENFQQKELQKKIKTTMIAGEYRPLVASNPAPVFFSQASFNNYENLLEQMKRQNERVQQRQNIILPMAFRQQEQPLQLLQPYLNKNLLSFDKFSPIIVSDKPRQNVEGVYVKEEYVKQEEVPATHGSLILGACKPFSNDCNTTNDSLSEHSIDKSELQIPECSNSEEPILAEFTKSFPDWDLATIFSFVKSGKAKDTFEKEKKVRLEKKLKKVKGEGKEKTENKQKVTKAAARSAKKEKEVQLIN